MITEFDEQNLKNRQNLFFEAEEICRKGKMTEEIYNSLVERLKTLCSEQLFQQIQESIGAYHPSTKYCKKLREMELLENE